MVEQKINPLTGHEDGLPDPRPRPEIWKELLASHQVDPRKRLSDVYYMLNLALKDLEPFVDAELAELACVNKTVKTTHKKSSCKK